VNARTGMFGSMIVLQSIMTYMLNGFMGPSSTRSSNQPLLNVLKNSSADESRLSNDLLRSTDVQADSFMSLNSEE
jgi:hypothetical protein